MTVVEELVSVLGLEIGSDALSTLSKFKAAVTQGLAGVGGVVAALGAAFAGTVVSVAELGTEVQQTAIKLGESTDAVQEMKYAADLTNVSFESLTTAMKFMSKNAAEGGDAAKRVFEAFSGIKMRDAQGNLKTATVLFEDFADKIKDTKDPIKQVELAMHALHGQSGVTVLPLLKLGKEGIRRLREEAQDLGYVLDKNTIEAGARFTVSLKHLKNALLGVRNIVGAPFLDDFSEGLEWLADRVRRSRAWFQGLTKDIRDLGQRFGRIIEVGKRAFEAIRQFIEQTKLDKLADAVHWTEMLEAALIGVTAVAVTGAAATAASWLIAAAPFLLIATVIGLIIDDIAHFLSGGESVLGMADKWAKRFDPNDAPEIKFFKNLLALLFDFGDPAKWRRVGESAKAGFQPFIEWLTKIRETQPLKAFLDLMSGQPVVGQDLSDSILKRIELSHAKGPDEINAINDKYAVLKAARSGDPEALKAAQHEQSINEFRAQNRKPFQISAEEIRGMSEDQYRAYVRQQEAQRTSVEDFRKQQQDKHAAAIEDFRTQVANKHAQAIEDFRQSVHVHIHGASDPHDPSWVKQVQDIIDKANSDARAAITGGT